MASQVIMPKLSPTMEEGQLSRWLKKEGDRVSMGEPLAEIDTDKATMEMQALANGVLRKILIKEGESAPLGELIAIIGEPEEDISELESKAQSSTKAEAPAEPPPAKEAPAAEQAGEEPTAQPASIQPPATKERAPAGGNGRQGEVVETSAAGRLIVSPLAARMAAEAGIDLRSLSGTGPGGRIIKRDIEEAITKGRAVAEPVKTEAERPRLRAVQPLKQPSVAGASRFRD